MELTDELSRQAYASFWRTDSNGTISVNGSAPAGLNPKRA
jgi:hypothetical protein